VSIVDEKDHPSATGRLDQRRGGTSEQPSGVIKPLGLAGFVAPRRQ